MEVLDLQVLMAHQDQVVHQVVVEVLALMVQVVHLDHQEVQDQVVSQVQPTKISIIVVKLYTFQMLQLKLVIH